MQDFTPADNSLFNAKVLYGIFKTNNLFLNRKCQKMFLKSHFQFFQSRELWNCVCYFGFFNSKENVFVTSVSCLELMLQQMFSSAKIWSPIKCLFSLLNSIFVQENKESQIAKIIFTCLCFSALRNYRLCIYSEVGWQFVLNVPTR